MPTPDDRAADRPVDEGDLPLPDEEPTLRSVAVLQLTRPSGVRWHALAMGSCLGALSLACASEAEYTTDREAGSTHALVSVERSTPVGEASAARAGALAGFVRVPATVDSNAALGMMGLELQLPELNRCVTWDALRELDVPHAPIDRVELVGAGSVSITVADAETTLAPRAFPTVTDLVSGVVYTTRDLAAEPLPAGMPYLIRTGGSDDIDPMELAGEAPPEPAKFTAGGTPLHDVAAIATSEPVDLTWTAGAAGDVIYVELSAGAAAGTVCAFDDATGSASVPAGAFAGVGTGRLAVHRVRSQLFEANGIERGELRFDFELVIDVTYTE